MSINIDYAVYVNYTSNYRVKNFNAIIMSNLTNYVCTFKCHNLINSNESFCKDLPRSTSRDEMPCSSDQSDRTKAPAASTSRPFFCSRLRLLTWRYARNQIKVIQELFYSVSERIQLPFNWIQWFFT